MSPMDGQKEFRGANPGYEGYAYREDAQVAAREKGTTRGMLDTRESGGPSLLQVELASISSRLESMETDLKGSGLWKPVDQVAPTAICIQAVGWV